MAGTGTSNYRILGIDPGLNVTGYAAVDFGSAQPRIVEAGTLSTNAKASLPDRITELHQAVSELLAEIGPDAAAIEQLYAHYKHPRTAILMGHARGVILLACRQAEVAVHSFSATMVKRAMTGNGHASKHQVQRAVQSLCKLEKIPSPSDVADALAIALCAGRRLVGLDGASRRKKKVSPSPRRG